MNGVVVFIALLAFLGSDRLEIRDGQLPAPGADRCVRLHATGPFHNATVRVNQINSGELEDERAELDITGYLSPGATNTIEISGARVERVWAWMSPLVYIASVRIPVLGRVEVTIVNTTENTAQVQVGEHQFTVSPGTRSTRELEWPGGARKVRMRAVSDGLDREFVDEVTVE